MELEIFTKLKLSSIYKKESEKEIQWKFDSKDKMNYFAFYYLLKWKYDL